MKALLIASFIIIALYAAGMWWLVQPDTTDTSPVSNETLSKYEVGPPDATEILELVNKERAKSGVAPLAYDARLEKSAQLKSDYMAEHNTKSHKLVENPNATLTQEMYSYTTQCQMSSENYAYTNGKDSTTKRAMDLWIQSEPHYKAILDTKYASTGIGVTYDKDQDLYYSVQRFCVAK